MNKNNNKKFLPGSAIIISLVILGAVFLTAFGAAYMVIVNMSKGIDVSEKIKAEQAAYSGMERFKFEVYSNNFDLDSAVCGNTIFSYNGENGDSYSIYCEDVGLEKYFYSLGSYKSKTVEKKINFPFLCGTDLEYEGQTYGTVKIGSQCWMADNLNVGNMVNSTTSSPCIDLSSGENFWSCQNNNNEIEKYCYDNNPSDCTGYGGLYEWSEALNLPYECNYNVGFNANVDGTYTGNCNGVDYTINEKHQGICPLGWHIPSSDEFISLVNYLDPNSLEAVKSSSTDVPAWDGTNSSGLSIPPSGARWSLDSSFRDKYYYTGIWTILPYDTSLAYNYEIYADISINGDNRSAAYSVRCVRD